MFAVVKVGGRQYRVSPGDEFVVEKLNTAPGTPLQLPVLLWSDEAGVKVGKPLVDGQVVDAQVLSAVKGKKMDVFRYQSKKRYRKKTGHRQTYTRIKILGDAPAAAAVVESAAPEAALEVAPEVTPETPAQTEAPAA